MLKKLLSSALALCMVLGSAAVLPEGASELGSQITASAEYDFSDFTYTSNGDGTIEITSYLKNAANVTIPSKIDGKKVTKLRDWLFYEKTNLKSVTIPEGVTSIGNSVFRSCTKLTTVKLPKTLRSIGDTAFFSCRSLKNITLPEGITSIGSNAFTCCVSLTGITIPSSVKSIGVFAFMGCTFKSIVIPNGVTSIGENAFSDCENLESVTIPSSVTYFGPYAFQRTKWLDNKRKKNPLVIINNIVIDGIDCSGKVTLPNGIKEIADCAFMSSEKLTGITIPGSVRTIGTCAFSFCDGLTSVEIPEGVTSIKSFAFGECKNLKSVTIPDSVKSIGDDLFLYTPDAAIRCNKGSYAEKYAKNNKIKVHIHSYTTKVVKPTYDAQGYTLHSCSCGCSYKDHFTKKLTRTSIAKAKVTGIKNKHYTGKAIKQTPVVKLGKKTLKAGTDYTVSYKNNKAIGTATVTITGKGAYTGKVTATFRICPKKTTLKKVTSPKSGQIKAAYSKVSGVTGYQVTYSTSGKFTKKTTKSVNVNGTSKTISKLTKGKTYYVKVRTYKTVKGTKYYSGYSKVMKIKVK